MSAQCLEKEPEQLRSGWVDVRSGKWKMCMWEEGLN